MPNKDTATNWWLPSQRQEFLSNLLTPEEPMVSTTICSIITADTTQWTYYDNVSSDSYPQQRLSQLTQRSVHTETTSAVNFYSQQRRRHQQLLQQHLLPESKEQETLDSAGPTWTAVQCEAGSDWPVGFGKTGGSGAGITISRVWWAGWIGVNHY